MHTIFSPLRASSTVAKNSPTTVLKQYRSEEQKSSGKHADVFIVSNKRKKPEQNDNDEDKENLHQNVNLDPARKCKKRKMYAMKRQLLHKEEYHKRAQRERVIFQSLTSLYKASKCFNFIYMHDWFEAEDDEEPLFAREEAQDEEEEVRKYPFMHFVLECADATLESCLAKLSLRSYKEIIFQVLYALDIAGREYEFCHYDLHPKNVLLLSLPEDKKCCMYVRPSATFYTSGDIVKITDFGLSRLKTSEGKILYNERDCLKELFTPGADLQSMAAWKTPRVSSAEEKQLLSSFKRKLRVANSPAELLGHPFFC